MLLAQEKGILYFYALLAHPCPVVFLRGQYPCLVSTVSCFSFPYFLFTFISHLPSSPLPCATYLCVDHIGSLLHLSHHPSRICCQLFIIIFLINLMFYNFLRGHVVSQPSWGAFGIKLISLKSVWLSESSAHASIVCSCFHPFKFSLFTSCSQCIFT